MQGWWKRERQRQTQSERRRGRRGGIEKSRKKKGLSINSQKVRSKDLNTENRTGVLHQKGNQGELFSHNSEPSFTQEIPNIVHKEALKWGSPPDSAFNMIF